MKWRIIETFNTGIGVTAIILVGLQSIFMLGIARSSNTYVLVSHISEVKEKLNLLISSLKDLETAERGYLLTNEARYLELYNSALPEIIPRLEEIKKLTSDNPVQIASLNILQPLIEKKLVLIAELIKSGQSSPNTLAILQKDLNKSKLIMDEIRLIITQIIKREQVLFQQSIVYTNRASQTLILMSCLGVLIDLFVLAIVYFTIRNEMSRYYHNEKALNQHTVELLAIATDAVITKDDFLARMSHDIRTPLSAIIGLNYLALQTKLNNQQRDYLQKIQKSGKYLLQLINDILDFSKLEAGMLEIEKIYFQLDESLSSIASVSEFLAQEKGLKLGVHIAPDVPHGLIGSPKRLEQILMNLIGNAIKFTEAGEVNVSIKCESGTQNQVTLLISVQDTGIGLAESQIDQLFKAFKQGEQSIERKYGGSGLGLAICKHLVKMMGGEIWVESEVGNGSCFKFTVICDRAQIAGGKEVLSLMGLAALRVLVVDDNQETRLGVKDMLFSLGFDSTTVASGELAIAELVRASYVGTAYNLAILDWILQDGMDGIETAKFIQNDVRIVEKPKMIMLTAYSQAYMQKDRIGSGFAVVLEKPLNRSTLFDAIVRVCGHIIDKTLYISASKIAPVRLEWLKGKKILLVEDNEINQQIAFELLTANGLVVEIANNGIEAIAWIHKHVFDCILMDVQMPEMNGLEATRQIRLTAMKECNEYLLNLPIIAMTANVLDGDRKISLEAGMNDYITKPIDPDIMFRTLLHWIPPTIIKENALANDRLIVATENTKQDFPAMPSIDIKAGLHYIGGKHNSYRKLLLMFRHNNLNVGESICSALTHGEKETALRLVHTIKGVAGSIGAISLQQATACLEVVIRADNTFAIELERFTNCLNEVINAIACLEKPLDIPPTPTDQTTIDSEIVNSLITRMVDFLEVDMIAAIDCLATLKTHLNGKYSDYMQSLDKAMETFNTDDAQNILQQLENSLKNIKNLVWKFLCLTL
ncbi:response regulator [Neosynechococcus sphagnicola]|uniref:response regulator n=1 Tax=Neosynechococcus sphagnicola TaxID=1501145 RepID=UPI00068DFA5E|nr:response regulator [Neosynechococcus sphagnicola]